MLLFALTFATLLTQSSLNFIAQSLKTFWHRSSFNLKGAPRLKLPADKENPLNSWRGAFTDELKMFRADLEHKHDDQVDALAYGLEYTKGKSIDWRLI